MDPNSRKATYDEVEQIREEIEEAFHAWHSQDLSVGQKRPSVEDLIDAIELVLQPITVVESKVTRVRPVVEANA